MLVAFPGFANVSKCDVRRNHRVRYVNVRQSPKASKPCANWPQFSRWCRKLLYPRQLTITRKVPGTGIAVHSDIDWHPPPSSIQGINDAHVPPSTADPGMWTTGVFAREGFAGERKPRQALSRRRRLREPPTLRFEAWKKGKKRQ